MKITRSVHFSAVIAKSGKSVSMVALHLRSRYAGCEPGIRSILGDERTEAHRCAKKGVHSVLHSLAPRIAEEYDHNRAMTYGLKIKRDAMFVKQVTALGYMDSGGQPNA